MPRIETEDGRTVEAPVIHLNGSHPDRLEEDFTEIRHALIAAFDKLATSGPNQRDYYVLAPEAEARRAWEAAVAEHRARLDTLNKLIADFEALQRHASDAAERRRQSIIPSRAMLEIVK